MKNKKYDKNTVIFAMLQMQTGISPELIYDSITQSKPILQKDEKALPEYDLDAMLASDEVQKIGDF